MSSNKLRLPVRAKFTDIKQGFLGRKGIQRINKKDIGRPLWDRTLLDKGPVSVLFWTGDQRGLSSFEAHFSTGNQLEDHDLTGVDCVWSWPVTRLADAWFQANAEQTKTDNAYGRTSSCCSRLL